MKNATPESSRSCATIFARGQEKGFESVGKVPGAGEGASPPWSGEVLLGVLVADGVLVVMVVLLLRALCEAELLHAVDMTFPNWHASSDDDFRVSAEARHGSVKLTFQYAPPGGATPHAPAKSVVLWQGLLPGYGPVAASRVIISTTSLS